MKNTPSQKPPQRRTAKKQVVLCPRCQMSPMEVTYDGTGCPICGYQEYSDELHDVRPSSVSHDHTAHTSLARGLQMNTKVK